MDDALLVGRAISGDLESFGQLFDQYYSRVYDFAWRTLGDPVASTEATRDVFLQAARRLPHGTAGMDFPAWLFSLAFNTVIPRAVTGGAKAASGGALHEEAFGSFEVPDPARVTDPALIGNDHELAVLVWEALTSLTPRDRAVLDLHVRQGLDSAAIAPALGLNKRDAANLVGRMKAAASDVVSSYVIARRGGPACERLQDVLAPFDMPPYTDAARRAVDAHVKDCAVCAGARSRLIPPLEVYGALAPGQPPVESKGDVWAAIAAGWAARRDRIAELSFADTGLLVQGGGDGLSLGGAGLGGGGGGYGAGSGGWDRRQVLWFAGAAAALIVFAFLVGFVATTALGGDDGNTPAVDGSTRTATATDTPGAAASITPGVAVLTATPNLTPSATPTVTDTPTPPPATETPVPATATATSKASATPTKSAGGTPTPTKTVKAASPTPTPHVTPTLQASPTP
jgi:DNA-directed RNA polymerase specialized sigma24 family protein